MEMIVEVPTDNPLTKAIFRKIFTTSDNSSDLFDNSKGLQDDGQDNPETKVVINNVDDIVRVRQIGRFMMHKMGFSDNQCTIGVTVISELARNILLYANSGNLMISSRQCDSRKGVIIKAQDLGPGIANIRNAMKSGFSTSGGLGYGLSGVRDMVDEFEINSHEGKGTNITATVWLK